ncbi:MAG: hypothetical protein Q4Q23_06915 [Methanobacteriaceae archaeon]|nr:hypothetical protein [Methanobacteriaceae archaeon]
MINFKQKRKLILPAFLAMCLILIPTLRYNWPLSWDIFYHINYAIAYANYGLTFIDPLLNAPIGKTIEYPPLFHFMLLGLSYFIPLDLISIARVLQIVFAFLSVFLISYIGFKLYGYIAGIATGFLLLSSLMFLRLVMPLPETLSLLFFTLAIYLYYNSLLQKKWIKSIVTGLLVSLVVMTHFSTAIYLMIILSIITIWQLIYSKKISIVLNYILMILPLIILGLVSLIVLSKINPDQMSLVVNDFINLLFNPMKIFFGQKAMGLERYITCIGILPLIFGIIGTLITFKTRKHLTICIWVITAFVLSNAHWFGIPVYTYRLLVYLLIPLTLIGGYGISYIVKFFEDKKPNVSSIIFIIIMILCTFTGIVMFSDEHIADITVENNISKVQIAPPSMEETEIINYFKNQEKTDKSVLINNLFLGTILSSSDEIPIHYSFDIYASPNSSKSSLKSLQEEKIGYIVYDKSLIDKDDNTTGISVKYVKSDFYPLYYYNKELNEENFNKIKLAHTTKTFENNRFIVCKVD